MKDGKMADNGSQLVAAQMAYDNEKKNPVIAWLLWFFFGGFGAHRFYLGSAGMGIAMLATNIVIIGLATITLGLLSILWILMFIWIIVEAFLLNGLTRSKNSKIQEEVFLRYGLATHATAMQQQYGAPMSQQPAQIAPAQGAASIAAPAQELSAHQGNAEAPAAYQETSSAQDEGEQKTL